MNKILDVMEDIKQNITDNQYKIIMDSLMAINKDPIIYKNHESNKCICLLKWLDTKLNINDNQYSCISKTHLQKYVITNYFDNCYYQNIDLVRQILKIYFMFSTKEQEYRNEYRYVRYRNADDYT